MGEDELGTQTLVPHDLSARLTAQLSSLRSLVEGVTASDMDRPGPAGAWSAKQHVAHLGRYHEVFLDRLARIRNEQMPAFEPYRADDDPLFAGWLALNTSECLDRIVQLRSSLIRVVQAMTREEFKRAGLHAMFGPLDATTWLDFFLNHEAHHLYMVFKRSHEGEAHVLSSLTAALTGDVRTMLLGVGATLEMILRAEPESRLAWKSIPLGLFVDVPSEIQSAWVFALRSDTSTGAERHPNSIQRVTSLRGSADLQTWDGRQWQSHRLAASMETERRDAWLTIPVSVWHRPVVGSETWIVVSFHTASDRDLIEELARDQQNPDAVASVAQIYDGRQSRA